MSYRIKVEEASVDTILHELGGKVMKRLFKAGNAEASVALLNVNYKFAAYHNLQGELGQRQYKILIYFNNVFNCASNML